jgi:PAS domain S-box-containing protein
MARAVHLLRTAGDLIRQRRYTDAVETYLQATETDPTDARAWFGLGVCLYKVGNLDVASIALERARRMGYPRAEEALARVAAAERRRAAEGSGAKATVARPQAPGRPPVPSRVAPPRPPVLADEQKVHLDAFLRVMLVENIESDRRAITQAITGTIHDVEVKSVPYGASTSDTMSGSVHYDIAILDWDEDPDAAAGLMQILKIKRATLFVICLTDTWDAEASVQMLEAGADYHLVKEEHYASTLPRIIARWARRDRATALQMQARRASPGEAWPTAVDALGDMILVVSPDYAILRVNKAATTGLRKREENLLGKQYSGLLYGLDEPPDSCPFVQALGGARGAEADMHCAPLETSLHIRAWPTYSSAGRISGAVGVLGPPAGQPAAHDRLFRSLTERANAGIAMVDPNEALQYANQAFGTIAGRSAGDLLDAPLRTLVAPRDHGSLHGMLQVAMDVGDSGGRLTFQCPDGRAVPADVRFGRIRANGKSYLVLTCMDAGDQAATGQDLPPGMADVVPDMLFKTDGQGRITWWNPSAPATSGRSPELLRGMPLTDLAADKAHNKFRHLVQTVLTKGRQVRSEELLMKRGDGSRFWGSLTLLPAAERAAGQAQGLRGAVRDITDRKVNEAIRTTLEADLPD